MRIMVLGGAGARARVTVRDLLAGGDVKAVGVGDVDVARAKQPVARLKSDRTETIRIDVRNADDLRRVLRHWDVAIKELGRGRPIEMWERDDVERVLTREE